MQMIFSSMIAQTGMQLKTSPSSYAPGNAGAESQNCFHNLML